MNLRVIILAQGSQQRMKGLDKPKQMLELTAHTCARASSLAPYATPPVTVIERTLFQISQLAYETCQTTVVCAGDLQKYVENMSYLGCYTEVNIGGIPMSLDTYALSDPGNSSLKGLDRFLHIDKGSRMESPTYVILLGDVVYSWDVLNALVTGTPWQTTESARMVSRTKYDKTVFVGSDLLSPGGGEIWGIHSTDLDDLRAIIADAMTRHPPAQVDGTYQPGQLRLALWAADRLHDWPSGSVPNSMPRAWFHRVPTSLDYTRDFDVPADLDKLEMTSVAALADDTRMGIQW